jgi:ParB-like chromosome segregation protein Spo0J
VAEANTDMGIVPITVPNMALMLSPGSLRDTDRKPIDIRAIGVDHIDVVDRERPLDKERVAELAESIKREGLLQPIGVRRAVSKGNQRGNYRLVYGAHRLAAAQLLAKDDPAQAVIAAAIFSEKMPDWACKMAEVAENLFRKDLSSKQKEAETALLTGLIRKYGDVDGQKAKGGRPKENGNLPNGSGGFQTVTQQVASALGVTDDTVRNRIKNAVKLAERQGLAIDTEKKTPESLSGDQLIAIGQAAQVAADSDRRQAQKDGKDPRKVNPHERLADTKVLAKLDVTDPKPFIDWCRKRLAGKHKPMSLDILRVYRRALDDLIAEYEAVKEA